MAAVEDDVPLLAASVRQWIRIDECRQVLRCRILLAGDDQLGLGPANRQLGQDFADPRIAARVAEQNQVVCPHVVTRDILVVLDRQLTAEVAVPFVGEPLEAGLSVGVYPRVPRASRTMYAQKPGRERIVDRPRQPRTLC